MNCCLSWKASHSSLAQNWAVNFFLRDSDSTHILSHLFSSNPDRSLPLLCRQLSLPVLPVYRLHFHTSLSHLDPPKPPTLYSACLTRGVCKDAEAPCLAWNLDPVLPWVSGKLSYRALWTGRHTLLPSYLAPSADFVPSLFVLQPPQYPWDFHCWLNVSNYSNETLQQGLVPHVLPQL